MENNKKILVVEDEISLRSALSNKLAHEGFAVLEAKNGKEGLEMALSAHPDLILLDIVMPVMDGMTMLQKLREDAWGAEAKIFMLTNLSDTSKVADAIMQGSYDYLVKTNWTLEDIVVRIGKKLGG
jgi:DNA-binding response OmpR family regulator